MFTLVIFSLLFCIAPLIGWAWARRLVLRRNIRVRAYYGRAVSLGLLVPGLILSQQVMGLIQQYQPDRCGSWWLGATPGECTLGFYLISRTLAALIFLVGPVVLLSVSLVLAVFWNVKANHRQSQMKGANKG